MKTKSQAFTLVELIVVIVILAILGTIAFISFQGYSRNSRDSVRIADINSAKKSLEIFITKAGFYPTPDNGTNITYSGAIVWTEGTLGSNVTKNIQSLNKVITDPLTATEYTYSITSSKTEYQIGGISEGGGLTGNIPTDSTYAADLSKSSAVAYISGNYNEKFTKVNSGAISWILAEPSIISTDKTTSTDLANILANKKLAYNNYPNIPSSFSTPGTETGGFNYSNTNPIIYSGTLEDLHDDNTKKLAFITNLKQAYASTDLATNPIYEDIMSVDTTTDSTGAINLAITFINSNKGGIKLEELALLPTSGITSGGGTGGGTSIGSSSSTPGASCKEIYDNGGSIGDGIYWLGTGSSVYQNYCDMTNSGWTLVMKIADNTFFGFTGTYWTNTTLYNSGNLEVSTNINAKYQSWNNVYGTQLRGCKELNTTCLSQTFSTEKTAYGIFSPNTFISAGLARADWLNLVPITNHEIYCNQNGVNNVLTGKSVRFGLIGNNENDCTSPASSWGFGNNTYGTTSPCGFGFEGHNGTTRYYQCYQGSLWIK